MPTILLVLFPNPANSNVPLFNSYLYFICYFIAAVYLFRFSNKAVVAYNDWKAKRMEWESIAFSAALDFAFGFSMLLLPCLASIYAL